MNIHYGVVGTGPVGRVFAGLLRQAGHRVTVLCHRPQTEQILKRRPVVVKGELKAYAQLDEVLLGAAEFVRAQPDVVLICTKSVDTEHLLTTLREHHPRPETLYVSCQNGIDTERVVAEVFGADHALRIVLNMGCDISCGNEVVVTFCTTHVMSKPASVDGDAVERIASDLRESGLPLTVSANWRNDSFMKALLNASLGSLCAVTRHCMNCVMDQPEARAVVEDMLREGIAICAAEGIELRPDFLAYAMHYLDQGGEHRPSILVDVEKAKVTENEFHCAELARLARRHGVPAPTIDLIDKLLRCTENF
ncbi:MAG: 2-dehydropantoate 2-reductase [Xanthomonadaceae bacterium]|nr:2-dehydropantoate 2-reductase [Xanthomonadaceae bacterium]MDE3071107.1 2-dehydropantoate 2-reductase [Pseudomonadota bacterium]